MGVQACCTAGSRCMPSGAMSSAVQSLCVPRMTAPVGCREFTNLTLPLLTPTCLAAGCVGSVPRAPQFVPTPLAQPAAAGRCHLQPPQPACAAAAAKRSSVGSGGGFGRLEGRPQPESATDSTAGEALTRRVAFSLSAIAIHCRNEGWRSETRAGERAVSSCQGLQQAAAALPTFLQGRSMPV